MRTSPSRRTPTSLMRGAAAADGETAALGTERDAVSDPARSIEDLESLAGTGVPNNHVAICKSGGDMAAVGRDRNGDARVAGTGQRMQNAPVGDIHDEHRAIRASKRSKAPLRIRGKSGKFRIGRNHFPTESLLVADAPTEDLCAANERSAAIAFASRASRQQTAVGQIGEADDGVAVPG